VTGIEQKSVLAALCVLVASLVLADQAVADAPAPPESGASLDEALLTAPMSPTDAGASGNRDRLMELVVEYLDFAFVRVSTATRTAQLEPAAAPAAVVQ